MRSRLNDITIVVQMVYTISWQGICSQKAYHILAQNYKIKKTRLYVNSADLLNKITCYEF